MSNVVPQRRRELRKRTFLGGLIVSKDGALVFDCTVRDLSESGARIKVAANQVIPKDGYLIISGRERAHEVKSVRFRNDEIGVQIVATHSLESLSRSELSFLRRLVVERLPRASMA